MNAYIEILRPNVCILASLAFVVGCVVLGISYPIPFSLIAAVFVVFLICGGGNVINDYYDYETDRLSKSHRPIPSGRITRQEAKLYASFLFLFGNMIAFGFFTPIATAYTIVITSLAWIYSWKLKKTPIGHFADGILASSPFALSFLLLSKLNSSLVVLIFMSFLGTVGREIVKGLEDFGSDKATRMKTLEIFLGRKNSLIMARILILLAVAISFIPYLRGEMNALYLAGIIIADFTFVYSLLKIDIPKYSQRIMKVGMFAALCSFLLGAVL